MSAPTGHLCAQSCSSTESRSRQSPVCSSSSPCQLVVSLLPPQYPYLPCAPFDPAVPSSADKLTTMAAQYFFDVVYSLANCLVCFPSSPQLKINSRSFKMLRLLGEVCSRLGPRAHTFPSPSSICWLYSDRFLGRLLLRLLSTRYLIIGTLCPQKDPLPFWRRVRLPGT